MIDLEKDKEAIRIINAILNNRGVAEVKNEVKDGKANLVIVEIRRQVKRRER